MYSRYNLMTDSKPCVTPPFPMKKFLILISICLLIAVVATVLIITQSHETHLAHTSINHKLQTCNPFSALTNCF